MRYMYCSPGISAAKFISKAVELVNTSRKAFLLAFILKLRQTCLFLFWFDYRNINHAFLRALKS